MFGTDQVFLSQEEQEAVKQNARKRLGLWRRRWFYSAGAFALSCVSVVPFSKGQFLHAYAEPFGRILVYMSMALLPVLVCCTSLWVVAWRALSDLEKEQN